MIEPVINVKIKNTSPPLPPNNIAMLKPSTILAKAHIIKWIKMYSTLFNSSNPLKHITAYYGDFSVMSIP
jgi:hypothetical protein